MHKGTIWWKDKNQMPVYKEILLERANDLLNEGILNNYDIESLWVTVFATREAYLTLYLRNKDPHTSIAMDNFIDLYGTRLRDAGFTRVEFEHAFSRGYDLVEVK